MQKTDLQELEEKIKIPVISPENKKLEYEVKIRKNPAFGSRARIAPKREFRLKEIKKIRRYGGKKECYFCNPEKCAKFSPESNLKKQYFLNNSFAFSNLFPFGKIHGVIVYNYKSHVLDPRVIVLNEWVDGLTLVQSIGKESKKPYVSTHVNCGEKAGTSLEHFHGQFLCENEPLEKVKHAMKNTGEWEGGSKNYWYAWIESMKNAGLLIDSDESNTVFYVEWSPTFGKVELVIINLDKPSFLSLSKEEIMATAKFLKMGVEIIMKLSDQFNVINLSASPEDDFCNQFRIFPRAPSKEGMKSWEGYLENLGETVPSIEPEDFVKKFIKS
ncbi:MAG: hypothetical protein QMD14_02050 [Candidatus Aenigmarchaeota archaeon]|nr:hypothetical protein [Candidatus Aenigmarchaeota archaeon]